MSNSAENSKKEEAKKRGRKPKKQVSPEEMKAMLLKSKDELNQVVKDLEGEYEKLKPLNLSKVNELVATTIENLKEDLEDLEEHIKEVEKAKSN